MSNEIETIKNEMINLQTGLKLLKDEIDTNKDGKVSVKEAKDFVVKIAREYIWLYITIIISIIGIMSPSTIDEWKVILSISLSLSTVVFGGYIKGIFQAKAAKAKNKKKETELMLDITKNSLNKMAIENEVLRNKILYSNNERESVTDHTEIDGDIHF